jgi:very-short-patch-repair endonuclease
MSEINAVKGQTSKVILNNKLQRTLRTNMTDAEQRLWRHLRGKQMSGFKFRRQHPFGNCILDFVCLDAMLVVEVDGGHHSERTDADNIRTAMLKGAGFRVLRFWNNQVLQELEVVKEVIWTALQNPSPPRPSP